MTLLHQQQLIHNMQVSTRKQLHLIINEMGYRFGVEVGVDKGKYTEYLLSSTDCFIYGVDSWQHIEGYIDVANISDEQHKKNMEQAYLRLDPYIKADRCQLIKSFSVEFAKHFIDGGLDFVYIDANHTTKGALSDINAWTPKVREGGMIAGHDFLEGLYLVDDELSEFGVISAVMEYLKDKHYRLYVTDELWPSWYFFKE